MGVAFLQGNLSVAPLPKEPEPPKQASQTPLGWGDPNSHKEGVYQGTEGHKPWWWAPLSWCAWEGAGSQTGRQ